MRRVCRTRAFVAGVVMVSLLLSMTVLFGATGPVVRITSPAAKARVQGVVSIDASITAGREVSYAILVVDGERPGATNAMPCSFSLDTRELADGPHQVTVEAYDDGGLIAASKTLVIYVKNRPGAAVTASANKTIASRTAKSVAGRTTSGVRVATEPAGRTAAATAGPATLAPLSPAKSVAASGPSAAPRTVASAEGVSGAAAPAPAQLSRGPLPEPTRTASSAAVAPRRAGLAEAGATAGLVSLSRAALPPAKATASRPAYRGHTVMVNGRTVEFDVVPVVRAGRLQGGFRALFANLGGQVSWHAPSRTARSVSEQLTVEVPSGSRLARVNGRGVDMGSPAEVQNGRTIVPVRFFAEVTGAAVAWDQSRGIAHLRIAPKAVAGRAQ